MNYKKTFDRWFYFLTFIPLWTLILGNYLNDSLFAHGSLERGFVEDYPALWLTAVGLIINCALIKKYKSLINPAKLNIIYKQKLARVLVYCVAIMASVFINHQWVVSQLSNKHITWFSYQGGIQYFFSNTLEQFNIIGLLYYFTCLFFWFIMLLLCFYLTTSMVIFLAHIKLKKRIKIDVQSYFYYSSAVVFSYMFYYVSLQINDLILEGFETFSLHQNRLVLMVISIVLLIVYSIITSLVKYQPTVDKDISKRMFKRETSLDMLIILLPFLVITIYTVILQNFMNQNTYILKSMLSFSALIIIVFVISLNQYFKVKRLETLRQIVVENNTLTSYTHTIESLYHEMRHEKHDFNNILLSLRTYFEDEDYEGLKAFYNREIVTLTEHHKPHFKLVTKLTHLKDVPLKGLLISKLGHLTSLGITLDLNILNFSSPMNSIDLCRSLGILIDNAVEACIESEDKKIMIALVEGEIIVGNSYGGHIDLDSVNQFGYSTKGHSRGVGLHALDHIIKRYVLLNLKTSLTDKLFLQKIESH